MKKDHVGVLLVNTGTPAELNIVSIKKYLKEFLSDKRVIQLPRIIWLPILYLFVLPFRPQKKIKDYKKIWMKKGSPLLVLSNRLLNNLKQSKSKSRNVEINIAMRYGEPNIIKQLENFKKKKLIKLLFCRYFLSFHIQQLKA